jgi:catechol 2,3-dioxygenase-like lactoylglutathione lyase family enzyme
VTFQLDTVFIWVTNLDRSLEWYAKLGVQPGDRHGAWQNMQIDGDVRFALHEGARPEGPSTAVPSFLVGDLDAELRRLENLGVEPTDPEITNTGVARFTTFTDPDGNEVQLLER